VLRSRDPRCHHKSYATLGLVASDSSWSESLRSRPPMRAAVSITAPPTSAFFIESTLAHDRTGQLPPKSFRVHVHQHPNAGSPRLYSHCFRQAFPLLFSIRQFLSVFSHTLSTTAPNPTPFLPLTQP